jgi:LCP family protein required for cell wall assembly
MVGALLGLFVMATAISGYLIFATVRDFVAGWKITAHPAGPGAGSGTPAANATPLPGSNTGGGFLPQKWSGTQRVTVLVMGIDRRPGEDENGYPTDSMILLTVDPVAQTGAMLSIPRDLWVEIPGYGVDRINTANRTGDYFAYPGGGPALAVKTVEYNLGIEVDYYVRLDFHAFETLIDTIGGIDVDNPADINDPYYPDGSYGYEPFYLPAGKQHLNGHDALRYARTRHDASDIARAERQQQVVLAVRDRVTSLNMLSSLIPQAPQLYQTLNESIWTDLSLEQIVGLALLAQDIPRENIQHEVIDYRYVLDYTTADGRQVLVPIREEIRELRDRLFSISAVIAPPTDTELKALMMTESAQVEVLNGAGVEGLAKATSEWLADQGVAVANFATADRSDYPNTLIYAFGDKPYTARWLAKAFNATVVSGAASSDGVDIRIILGADWSVPGP